MVSEPGIALPSVYVVGLEYEDVLALAIPAKAIKEKNTTNKITNFLMFNLLFLRSMVPRDRLRESRFEPVYPHGPDGNVIPGPGVEEGREIGQIEQGRQVLEVRLPCGGEEILDRRHLGQGQIVFGEVRVVPDVELVAIEVPVRVERGMVLIGLRRVPGQRAGDTPRDGRPGALPASPAPGQKDASREEKKYKGMDKAAFHRFSPR